MIQVVEKLFEERELEAFKHALLQDKTIVPGMIRILESRIKTKERITLDDPNWAIKRAAYDGHVREIQWWVNFLKEGQGGQKEKDG